MKRILRVVAVVAGIIVVINAPAILSWIGAGLLSLAGTILSWIVAGLLRLIAAILTPIMPILLVVGAWVGLFGFLALVTSGPRTPKTTEEKILEELEKMNRKNGW